jgi:beta-glucosidase/6-phospho-beta-glucosidase/beta-galactosidase
MVKASGKGTAGNAMVSVVNNDVPTDPKVMAQRYRDQAAAAVTSAELKVARQEQHLAAASTKEKKDRAKEHLAAANVALAQALAEQKGLA